MSVFTKIDAIFNDNNMENKPVWADEILNELKEIKILLKEQKQATNKIDKRYYDFVQEFRRLMKADVQNNMYPTYTYRGKRLGIDHKGLLYDKQTQQYLSRSEAFSVYKHAYTNGANIS